MVSSEFVNSDANVFGIEGVMLSAHHVLVGEFALIVGMPSVILVVPLDGS